jgi:hypothetical protein
VFEIENISNQAPSACAVCARYAGDIATKAKQYKQAFLLKIAIQYKFFLKPLPSLNGNYL